LKLAEGDLITLNLSGTATLAAGKNASVILQLVSKA
jgi:hypothetical protein